MTSGGAGQRARGLAARPGRCPLPSFMSEMTRSDARRVQRLAAPRAVAARRHLRSPPATAAPRGTRASTARHRRPGPARCDLLRGASGSSTTNSVPASGDERHLDRAPVRPDDGVRGRQPQPGPPSRVVKNGSKMRARSAAGMLPAESQTRIARLRPRRSPAPPAPRRPARAASKRVAQQVDAAPGAAGPGRPRPPRRGSVQLELAPRAPAGPPGASPPSRATSASSATALRCGGGGRAKRRKSSTSATSRSDSRMQDVGQPLRASASAGRVLARASAPSRASRPAGCGSRARAARRASPARRAGPPAGARPRSRRSSVRSWKTMSSAPVRALQRRHASGPRMRGPARRLHRQLARGGRRLQRRHARAAAPRAAAPRTAARSSPRIAAAARVDEGDAPVAVAGDEPRRHAGEDLLWSVGQLARGPPRAPTARRPPPSSWRAQVAGEHRDRGTAPARCCASRNDAARPAAAARARRAAQQPALHRQRSARRRRARDAAAATSAPRCESRIDARR